MERASAHTLRGIAENLGAASAALGTLVLMGYIAGGGSPFERQTWVAFPVIIVTFVGTATIVAWWRANWSDGRTAKSSCLAACICPSCGYQLTEIPRQADGCTVCPECGAAWRLP